MMTSKISGSTETDWECILLRNLGILCNKGLPKGQVVFRGNAFVISEGSYKALKYLEAGDLVETNDGPTPVSDTTEGLNPHVAYWLGYDLAEG